MFFRTVPFRRFGGGQVRRCALLRGRPLCQLPPGFSGERRGKEGAAENSARLEQESVSSKEMCWKFLRITFTSHVEFTKTNTQKRTEGQDTLHPVRVCDRREKVAALFGNPLRLGRLRNTRDIQCRTPETSNKKRQADLYRKLKISGVITLTLA